MGIHGGADTDGLEQLVILLMIVAMPAPVLECGSNGRHCEDDREGKINGGQAARRADGGDALQHADQEEINVGEELELLKEILLRMRGCLISRSSLGRARVKAVVE